MCDSLISLLFFLPNCKVKRFGCQSFLDLSTYQVVLLLYWQTADEIQEVEAVEIGHLSDPPHFQYVVYFFAVFLIEHGQSVLLEQMMRSLPMSLVFLQDLVGTVF